mgnify:CR=1 FL=1
MWDIHSLMDDIGIRGGRSTVGNGRCGPSPSLVVHLHPAGLLECLRGYRDQLLGLREQDLCTLH